MSALNIDPIEPPRPPPTEEKPSLGKRFWWFMRYATRRALITGERLPMGVRTLVGIALMIGGVFGFLPILGFWMIPTGVAILSLDFPPLHRRILRWLDEG